MADNTFMRQLEAALQHWVERAFREHASEASLEGVVALGGGMAVQHYLIGDAREELTGRAQLRARFTLYCATPLACEQLARKLADGLNSLASYYGPGKPHSAWVMLSVSLRRLGVILVGQALPEHGAALFRAMHTTLDKKRRWSLALRTRQFGQASDLSVLTVEPATAAIRKAMTSDAVSRLRRSSWGADVAVLPLSLLMQQDGVSKPVRMLLAKAVVSARVDVANAKAYDFALRATAGLLNAADASVPPALAALPAYQRVRAFTLGKHDPQLVEDLHRQAQEYAKRLELPSVSADLPKKKPGRYADMQLQLDAFMRRDTPLPGSRTGLSVHQLLHLYTVQSSQLNVACLLAGAIPELQDRLVRQGRFLPVWSSSVFPDPDAPTRVSYWDYMHDMDAAFAAARPPRPAGGVPYKPLVVFRAVDLFELPRLSVYTRALPFDIVNHTLCSTSTLLRPSTGFLKTNSTCCMMRITAPASYTRMLAVKAVSGYASEEEVLFPRGSVFVVHARSFRRHRGVNIALLEATVEYRPDALRLAFDGAGGAGAGGAAGRVFLDLSPMHAGGSAAQSARLTAALIGRLLG